MTSGAVQSFFAVVKCRCRAAGTQKGGAMGKMRGEGISAVRRLCAVLAGMVLTCAAVEARVTKIVIDETVSPAFCKGDTCASYGAAGQYEQIAGRAWGELDPRDPLNALIQDIDLAKDADGKVRYVATFVIERPVDPAKASGMMWHEVPNRGRPVLISRLEREFGDIGLATAWQGDNASMGPRLGTAVRPTMGVNANHWLQLPVA